MNSHIHKIHVLNLAFAAKEQKLLDEIAVIKQREQGVSEHLAQREKEFGEQLLQLRQEVQEEQRRIEAQREKEFSEQLQRVQQDTDARLQQAQEEVRRSEQEGAARERVLTQNAIQSRQDLEDLLRRVAQREKEIGEQLFQLQQEAERARAEQVRIQAEREQTLNREIAGLQNEIQVLNHAQQLQAHLHGFELTTKQGELDGLIQTCTVLEAQLKAQILSEQQTSLQFRQTIAEVEQNLAMTQASLSWRMTAPLRKIASFIAPGKGHSHSFPSPEQSEPPKVIEPTVVEPQPPKGQPTSPASMELIMPSAAQASFNLNAPAVAATLDDLLARPDRLFIHCAYQTLLGRDPDEEGFNYYLGRLRFGIPKIHILSQLRRSEEGRDYAAELPRLDAAIRRYRWAQSAITGWLVRRFVRVEGNSWTEQKLRGLESQIFLLGEESNRRFNQMEKTLTGLQHLVADQIEQLKSAATSMRSAAPVAPEPPSPSLNRLQPKETIGSHTAGIFTALKDAISAA